MKTKSKRVKQLISDLKNKQPQQQVDLCAKAFCEWDGEDKKRVGRMLEYYDDISNRLRDVDFPETDTLDYLDDDEFYTCPMTGGRVALDGTLL